MSALIRFFKTTFVGGVLFVLPFFVLVLILREALRHVAHALQPIAKLFPEWQLAGWFIADLLAIAVIVAVCFLLGLIITTRAGLALSSQIDSFIVRRVPGFLFVKTVAQGMTGFANESDLTVALVSFDDSHVLGFVVERHTCGLVTVFVPSAPTPAMGSIYFMEEARVKPLPVSVMTAIGCVLRLGVGSGKLLDALPPATLIQKSALPDGR